MVNDFFSTERVVKLIGHKCRFLMVVLFSGTPSNFQHKINS